MTPRAVYQIQVKSVVTAIEHLATIDLDELAACAEKHGTNEERRKIGLARQLVAQLAPGHGPGAMP